MWGIDGLGMNVEKVKVVFGVDVLFDSWLLLFDLKYVKKLKCCGVLVFDLLVDVFGMVFVYLKKDLNMMNLVDY